MAEKCSRENRPARPSDTAHSWTNATSSKRPVGGSNPSRDARQKSRVTVPDSNPYQKVRIFVSQKEPKMTNRHPAFHHANDTETSRDGREDMDTRSPETEAGSMQIVAQSYFQPEHAVLPLQGFFRLYEAQLRSERKSARTIKIYNGALGKFWDWSEQANAHKPVLSDFVTTQVRLFLADAMDKPKWDGHPILEGITKEKLASATLHQYFRGLKTFGAWLEREGYASVHPPDSPGQT